MSGFCCNPKKNPTHDASMSLLLSVVATNSNSNGNCCKSSKYLRNKNYGCNCNGNAGPTNRNDIYRNNQIIQIQKLCNNGCYKKRCSKC